MTPDSAPVSREGTREAVASVRCAQGTALTLPTILVLCFLVAVGVGLFLLASVRTALVREWGKELAGQALGIADALDRVLSERAGDIQVLAEHPTLAGGTPAAKATVLQRYREVYGVYAWIGVTDGQGRVTAATDPAQVGRDASAQAWFQEVRRTGRLHLGEAQPASEAGGRLAVSFSAPIRGAQGEFRGVVSSRVALESLRRLMERGTPLRERHGESLEWLLLDREGLLLSDEQGADGGAMNLRAQGLPSAERAAAIGRGMSGFVEEKHIRRSAAVVTGYARTRGYQDSPGFDWTVLVRLNRAQVYAPIDRLVWQAGAVGLLVVAPLTAFGVWTARRLVRDRHVLEKAGEALKEAGRVSEERTAALQALVEAVRRLTAEPDLDRLLAELTEAARQLTGARYAALGLLGTDDPPIASFRASGMDAATQAAIGSPPTGRGLLGVLAREAAVLRLKDLTQHPAFKGFPAHHPSMGSFLGAPIRVKGEPFGQLYLTEKQGADEFTATDEHIVAGLAAQAGVAIENAQLFRQVQQAEAQYRAARDQLANVLEHAPDIIIFTDRDGRITLFNQGAERLLGHRSDEMVGKPVADLYVDPEARAVILREVERAGEVVNREVRLRAKDGSVLTISLTLSPYRDSEGRPIGTVGLSKDITAAKRLEQALLASNAELENFVYAVSHDLQTPLRGIHGFAELLVKRAKDRLDERERHYLERIQAGSHRMATLISDLLEYSRIDRITHPFEMVSMEQVVTQVRMELKDLIRQSQTQLHYEGRLPMVWADRLRMGQLWQNLLSNAIKYVKAGETPRVTIGGREDGDGCTFWVRDEGIGIPPEFHQRVFELFRRLHTHEQYEGTGVGLAIVKRIVEFHRGRIWVESQEGQGSTFFFTLPKPPVAEPQPAGYIARSA